MNARLRETIRLALAAALMGLSIVLTRAGSVLIPIGGVPVIRIGFGTLPIVLASLLCGPIWGGLAGAGSDLIGAFAFPLGSYFFGYTISAALQGILPWVLLKVFHRHHRALVVYDASLLVVAIGALLAYVYLTPVYSDGRDQPVYDFPLTPLVRAIITAVVLALALLSLGATLFMAHWARKGQPAIGEPALSLPLPETQLAHSRTLWKAAARARRAARPQDRPYSALELYSAILTNGFLLMVLLYALWTSLFYGLPYGYSLFNAMARFFITTPVFTAAMILIVDPLTRIGAFGIVKKTVRVSPRG